MIEPGDIVVRGVANHAPARLYRTYVLTSGDWVGTMEKDDRALVLNIRQQLGWVEELRLDPS